ncbi:MAG: Flp pilus assembly protein CpaB [Phototrophicales bacterium]|jgi:pilus assembly protein CpaB|nr:MAG: Flp pilus assembly protein CpaB [Phototrophicales bacterium]
MSGRTRVLILLALLIVGAAVAAVFILPGLQRSPSAPTNNQTVTEGQRPTNTPAVTNTPVATPLPTQELTQIVVAVQNITRGTVIPPAALELRPWPIEALPFNHFKNIEDVVGGIARTDIYVEQPILTSLVVRSLQDLASVGSDVAAIIPPGRRLVSLPLDRFTSNAYALQPGDYVDVITAFIFADVDEEFQTYLPNNINLINTGISEEGLALNIGGNVSGRFDTRRIPFPSFDAQFTGSIQTVNIDWPVIITPNGDRIYRFVTHITVQDALVMGVGEFPADGILFRPLATPTPVPTAAPAGAQTQQRTQAEPTATTVPPRPDIITLAVSPQEAVILNHMLGLLVPMTFSLRSAGDRSRPETVPVSTQYILDLYGVAPPPRTNVNLVVATDSIRLMALSLKLAETITVPEGFK